MKIRSLLLGSAAIAGLATGGYAADLGVVTSLDVCDELGLSGLTISSDDNCLVITGGVTYEFKWGDYANSYDVVYFSGPASWYTIMEPNSVLDHSSDLDAWLQFTATAGSSMGSADGAVVVTAEGRPAGWLPAGAAAGAGPVADRLRPLHTTVPEGATLQDALVALLGSPDPRAAVVAPDGAYRGLVTPASLHGALRVGPDRQVVDR